jgi:hypothetical protein
VFSASAREQGPVCPALNWNYLRNFVVILGPI